MPRVESFYGGWHNSDKFKTPGFLATDMSESNGGDRIVCRQCGEIVSVNAGNCPHCGAGVRSSLRILGALLLGIGIVAISAYGIVAQGQTRLWFFALIGAAITGISYLFFTDRRSRVQEATEQAE